MTKEFPVVGMACSQCAAHVERCLQQTEGVTSATVSLLLRTATIAYDPARTSPALLAAAVNSIGYTLVVDSTEVQRAVEKRASHLLRRKVVVAWLLAALTMTLSMRWVVVANVFLTNQLLFLLALASLLFCGKDYYLSAAKDLRHGHGTMSILVALSTASTFLFSAVNTFFGDDIWGCRGIDYYTYYDTTTMILAFVLTGRLLEERAKDSATAALRQLMSLAPTTAQRVDGDSDGEYSVHTIPLTTLRRGDRLLVSAGETIPADGEVVSAKSFMDEATVYVDESMLTGEATPVGKKKGSLVAAGSVVSQGQVIVAATATGETTALAQIISTVRRAIESKGRVQRIVDSAAAIFVPTVLVIAVITVGVWLAAQGTAAMATALLHGVAVLVIACPCAMGLAAPTALMVGMGRAAKEKVLIKDVVALERLAAVDTVVVDKTGTLTIPNPNIDFTKTDLPLSLRETLKPSAKEGIAALQSAGITVVLLSGDNAAAVQHCAEQVGIADYRSGQTPQEKEAFVRQRQKEGHMVAMVGDGINDTQALAVADVSVAMGTGTELARDVAQVTLLTGEIAALPAAITLSRQTRRVLWQNLFWAFIYNIVCIPLAAGAGTLVGITFTITPLLASALMAASSISVVANSLRLRH